MDDADGFEAGASGTRGDPRVLVAMNVVLSTVFAATVVWGLSYLGAAEFTLVNVATGAVLLVIVLYVVSTR